MENFLKNPVFLVLLIGAFCQTYALIHNRIPHHHKVRHKHNILFFDDERVNEIREAFDDYKAFVKPKTVHEVDVERISLRHHRKSNEKLTEELTEVASADEIPFGETSIAWPHDSQLMTRYKRVHTTETTTSTTTTTQRTTIFSDNYDEEYQDEDEDSDEKAIVQRVQETETAGQTMTDYKMASLGTRDDVRRSFEQHRAKEKIHNYDQATITKRIRENIMRTKIEGMCRWPNKKVIEMPQHASKMYTPRKYLIYQCTDDTACCGTNDKTCVAKSAEELVLWFHIRYPSSTGYESLKVKNHTECECVYKNHKTQTHLRHDGSSRVSHLLPKTTTRRTKSQQCRCPLYFDLEIDDGDCNCVCRNSKVECRRRYEGKEGFTISDQRCITRKECTQPHCLYGTYSTITGRCPDRNEKLRRGFHGG